MDTPECRTKDFSCGEIEDESESRVQRYYDPVCVWTAPNVPRATATNPPAIFFSPHQDDEALAMGASIAEHARSGRPVYVVLLSNGNNKVILSLLNGVSGNCPVPGHGKHDFKLTMQDVINARNAEFIASCQSLGVHKIYIANEGYGFDESVGLENLVSLYQTTMLSFQIPGIPLSLKTISGDRDYYPDKNGYATLRHQGHRACAIAAHNLYMNNNVTDIRLYRIYTFYNPNKGNHLTADWVKGVSSYGNYNDKLKRKYALNAYNVWNPSKGKYAIGEQHSVGALFLNSFNTNYEYIDYTY